jgi:hypothetical protein
VSGGDALPIGHQADRWVLLKLFLRRMFFIFCLLRSTGYKNKIASEIRRGKDIHNRLPHWCQEKFFPFSD